MSENVKAKGTKKGASAPKKQTLEFQTAVKHLLHLLAHSLYSNKEVFLRELISNAADALDKLRFEGLSDKDLYEEEAELQIWVRFDEDAKTVTIIDNGIGMDRDELISNLGTIAKSGTQEFLKNMTGDQSKDAQLIGQFGVGFYSAFVVADRVTVRTRRAGLSADRGVLWESTGEGSYVIEALDRSERGTEVTLHLKEEEKEFLNHYTLRTIIEKYATYFPWPIVMEKPVPPKEEGDAESDSEGDDATEAEVVPEDEVINQAKALWTLPKSEVTDEEYQACYKQISHDFEDALSWAHHRVEGKQEYISLLYLPKRAPHDLYQREHREGLKLYVQRVFIMDDAEHFLPMYLRFVRGIIDSSDLPLNVSRELLQNNQVVRSIRSGCVKRALDMIEALTKDSEQYAAFWKAFGNVLKEGPAEDFANKDCIAGLLRFASTHTDEPEQKVAFADYIGRMQEDQDKIYYVTAETFPAAKNSPHLEIFRKKGVEVLLLTDRVDEWLMSHITEFEGKSLQSVAKGEVDWAQSEDDEASKETKTEQKADFEAVLTHIKEVLGDKVKEVRLTHRLTRSPACLVAEQNDMSGNLQRMLQGMGQGVPEAKPIFELNPEHPLVAQLKEEQDDARFGVWSQLLLDQALIAEGGKLEDPASFVKQLNTLMVELLER